MLNSSGTLSPLIMPRRFAEINDRHDRHATRRNEYIIQVGVRYLQITDASGRAR